jgi:hypothetical protein
VRELPQQEILGAALAPDGRMTVVAGSDESGGMQLVGIEGAPGRTRWANPLAESHLEWIYIWDVASGTMRRKFRHPHGHGCKLTLAADGRTLATSDLRDDIHDVGEDTIRLYDIESGNQILTIEPGDGRAGVLVFSPNGERLFAGFDRGSGIVWDVRRGLEVPRSKE